MNTPTEPGFFWALWGDTWIAVEVQHAIDDVFDVLMPGSAFVYRAHDFDGWGERIQREGEQ